MGNDARKKRIAWTILAAMFAAILALCAGGFYIVLRAEYMSNLKWIDCPILVESRAAPLVDTIPPFELVLTNSTMVEIGVEAAQFRSLKGSFSPSLGHLAIFGSSEVQVWELSSTQNTNPVHQNLGYSRIESFTWSWDDTQLAVSVSDYDFAAIEEGKQPSWNWDNWVSVWDITTHEKLHTLMGLQSSFDDSNYIRVIYYSPDGELLIAQSGDGFFVWDSKTGETYCHFASDVLDPHTEERLLSIGWRTDAPPLVSRQTIGRGIPLNSTLIWDAGINDIVLEIDTEADRFVNTDWSPDSSYVALRSSSAAYGKSLDRLTVWDASTGDLLLSLDDTFLWDWAPDGQKIVVTSTADETSFSIWNLEIGEQVYISDEHEAALMAVRWAADGETLGAAYENGDVLMWSIEPLR
jgi:WD40 repeat protein